MADLQETQQLSFSAAEKYATFGVGLDSDGVGVQSVTLRTTADCYIDFDKGASAGTSFLLKSTDEPMTFDFANGNVKTVHAIAVSSSGTLYILGVR